MTSVKRRQYVFNQLKPTRIFSSDMTALENLVEHYHALAERSYSEQGENFALHAFRRPNFHFTLDRIEESLKPVVKELNAKHDKFIWLLKRHRQDEMWIMASLRDDTGQIESALV
jgi:hypothetical protein